MKVVYSEKMVAPAQGTSPSAAKPAAVMAAWKAEWPGLEIRSPEPVTKGDFYRAHKKRYVDAVLSGAAHNGFGTVSSEVNASLPYTTGALLTAARWALACAEAVAAPVSGFHHAGYDSGGGYCTFNGLMVTALSLQSERPGIKVGILDYDYHFGDGTEEILRKLQCPDVLHITAGDRWLEPSQSAQFLEAIQGHVASLAECDIVLYQAGADAHIDDPLGGFLTTSQMAQRDFRVFKGLRDAGIPVAWVLAGGYQEPLSKVIDLHVNSMRSAELARDA